MNVYLAEPLSRQEIKEAMKVYLAGENEKNMLVEARKERDALQQGMHVFLAGEHPVKNGSLANWENNFILESYFYLRNNTHFPRLVKCFGDFLLDSGAFTFLNSLKKGERPDWDGYIEKYAEFINQWDIEKFIELDIDSLVGINEVERLRYKLEKLTGKKPIPVWHKGRGKDYFISMCKQYPYVAIGGIVTKEIPTDKYELLFPWFIKTAHENGAKIHGLGYTRVPKLSRFKFDSVDSTAWLYGNRGGYVYRFNPSRHRFQSIQRNDRLGDCGRVQKIQLPQHCFDGRRTYSASGRRTSSGTP